MTRCGLKRGVFGLAGGLCGRTLAGEHDRRRDRASGDSADGTERAVTPPTLVTPTAPADSMESAHSADSVEPMYQRTCVLAYQCTCVPAYRRIRSGTDLSRLRVVVRSRTRGTGTRHVFDRTSPNSWDSLRPSDRERQGPKLLEPSVEPRYVEIRSSGRNLSLSFRIQSREVHTRFDSPSNVHRRPETQPIVPLSRPATGSDALRQPGPPRVAPSLERVGEVRGQNPRRLPV